MAAARTAPSRYPAVRLASRSSSCGWSAIRFQGLFVQRPRHHIIIGKLDKIIAHFLNEPVIGGLSKKDVPKGNKTDNNGKTQQEMLE